MSVNKAKTLGVFSFFHLSYALSLGNHKSNFEFIG